MPSLPICPELCVRLSSVSLQPEHCGTQQTQEDDHGYRCGRCHELEEPGRHQGEAPSAPQHPAQSRCKHAAQGGEQKQGPQPKLERPPRRFRGLGVWHGIGPYANF